MSRTQRIIPRIIDHGVGIRDHITSRRPIYQEMEKIIEKEIHWK